MSVVVNEIEIAVSFTNPDGDNVRRKAIFLRRSKIDELLEEEGTLGDLLRALLAPVPLDDVDVESIDLPFKKEVPS